MQIQGTVIAVCEKRTGVAKNSGNPFASLDFVVEIPGQYQRHVCLNIFGEDKIQEMNPQVGENVLVDFDIDAHEWQGRWFNSLKAWRLTKTGGVTQQQQQSVFQQPAYQSPLQGAAYPMNTAQFPPGPPQGGTQTLPF